MTWRPTDRSCGVSRTWPWGTPGRWLGDFHLAEDAAQEAFVEAFAGLDKVYGAAAFAPWLRRIVFKQCDRTLRRRREETGGAEVETAPAAGPDPLQVVEAGDAWSLAHGALAALPEAERTVALLFYINDHSQREIGAFLDLPVSTVKNRLRAARKRLKAEVTDMLRRDLQARRPSQNETFSTQVQDYLNALRMLHEKLLPMLEKTFAEASDGEVEVAISEVVHTRFKRYINSAPGPRWIYSFKVRKTDERKMMLEYSVPLIDGLLRASDGWDQLGEGRGHPDPRLDVTRAQTDLLHRADGPIKTTIKNIEALWSPVMGEEMTLHDGLLETEPSIVWGDMGFDKESDPELVQISLDVKGARCQGTVHLCYPVFTLEPVLPGLAPEE